MPLLEIDRDDLSRRRDCRIQYCGAAGVDADGGGGVSEERGALVCPRRVEGVGSHNAVILALRRIQ